MADPIKELLDQYLAQAQTAYEADNFQDAYKICLKVLEMDPENADFLNLKEKIENAVQNYNIHLVDKEIEKLQPLWKEERYGELVNNLQQLFKAVPHYEKLEKLLAEAEEKYRNQTGKKSEETVKSYEANLNQLLEQNLFSEIIDKINETERHHPKEETLRKIHEKIKEKIIDKKLEQKKSLMDSEKYEDIVNFLYQLRFIDTKSKKVEKFLQKYRKKLLGSQLAGKQDFIFRSKEKIKNLILLGKFEFAIQACEDLLSVDPKNLFAKKTIYSCEAKLKKLLRETMFDQIMQQHDEQKKNYETNPSEYIKI